MIDSRDQLDAAIDRIATKLVSVQPDGLTTDRIASGLPERVRRGLKPSPSDGINWTWLAPQFAAAVGVALLAFFLFSNRSMETERMATHGAVAPVAPPAAPVAPTAPTAPSKQRPVFAVAASGREGGPAADTFEQDHGLPPVPKFEEIDVKNIEIPATEIAPIVLTELPLASDSPLPR